MANVPVYGVVMELNPMHNGHQYLINEIKNRFDNPLIVAISSGYFTMRGEGSLMSKRQKVEELLKIGVDLIIELPTVYTLNSANLFAKYAIELLKKAKIDYLSFGTEKLNNDELLKITKITNSPLFNQTLKKYLKENSLKIAHQLTYQELKIDEELANLALKPNNTLALEYINALENNQFKAINRIGQFDDDSNITDGSKYPSGTALRKAFESKLSIDDYIPYDEKILKHLDLNILNPLLQSLILKENELKVKYKTDEGEINYILKNITTTSKFEDTVKNLTNKKYSTSKIRRELLKIILNLDKQPQLELRVLGFNERGAMHLKKIDTKIKSSLKDLSPTYYQNEYHAAYLYSILINENIIKDEFIFPIKEQTWKN